jgi:hypothetical protein
MDRFELGVRHGGLGEHRDVVSCEEPGQVVDCRRHPAMVGATWWASNGP